MVYFFFRVEEICFENTIARVCLYACVCPKNPFAAGIVIIEARNYRVFIIVFLFGRHIYFYFERQMALLFSFFCSARRRCCCCCR